MNKKAVILLAFLFGTLQAWSSSDSEPLYLRGVIYQQEGLAVKGAEVIVEENGEAIHSVFSDKEGQFRLKLENQSLDRLNIRVIKNGFETEQLIPVSCKKQILHIKLKAKAPQVVPVFHQKGMSRSFSI